MDPSWSQRPICDEHCAPYRRREGFCSLRRRGWFLAVFGFSSAVSDVCCNFCNNIVKFASFSHVPTLGCAAAPPGPGPGRPWRRGAAWRAAELPFNAFCPELQLQAKITLRIQDAVRFCFRFRCFDVQNLACSSRHCLPARAPHRARARMSPAGCDPLLLPR